MASKDYTTYSTTFEGFRKLTSFARRVKRENVSFITTKTIEILKIN